MGLSWLGVDMMWTSPPLPASQTHPLPNCFTPASLNLVWKSLKLPKDFLMTSAIAPLGSPPPLGFMIFQYIEWFMCPPPLLRTVARMSSGTALRSRSSSSALFDWRLGYFSRAAFRFLTYAP